MAKILLTILYWNHLSSLSAIDLKQILYITFQKFGTVSSIRVSHFICAIGFFTMSDTKIS